MVDSPLRISVAMTTYQGATFLEGQLSTLEKQSRPADEIVISDDASSDRTWDILRDFAERSRVPVRLLRQERNVGLRANIQHVLSACTGTVVVLADQDDLWMTGKLGAIAHAFSDPEVTLWFSDAALINENGDDLGRTAWQATNFNAVEQQRFVDGQGLRRLLQAMTVTGATMAVRSNVIKMGLPLPAQVGTPGDLFLHDAWLALLASMRGRVVVDPTQYTAYRQHPQQVTEQSMARVTRPREAPPVHNIRQKIVAQRPDPQLVLDHARTKLLAQRLRDTGALVSCRQDAMEELLALESLLDVRVLPRGTPGRRTRVLTKLARGHYSRFARGWVTAARDLA